MHVLMLGRSFCHENVAHSEMLFVVLGAACSPHACKKEKLFARSCTHTHYRRSFQRAALSVKFRTVHSLFVA